MKGLKPLRVDGGFRRLTEILPALRDTDGDLRRLKAIRLTEALIDLRRFYQPCGIRTEVY